MACCLCWIRSRSSLKGTSGSTSGRGSSLTRQITRRITGDIHYERPLTLAKSLRGSSEWIVGNPSHLVAPFVPERYATDIKALPQGSSFWLVEYTMNSAKPPPGGMTVGQVERHQLLGPQPLHFSVRGTVCVPWIRTIEAGRRTGSWMGSLSCRQIPEAAIDHAR